MRLLTLRIQKLSLEARSSSTIFPRSPLAHNHNIASQASFKYSSNGLQPGFPIHLSSSSALSRPTTFDKSSPSLGSIAVSRQYFAHTPTIFRPSASRCTYQATCDSDTSFQSA